MFFIFWLLITFCYGNVKFKDYSVTKIIHNKLKIIKCYDKNQGLDCDWSNFNSDDIDFLDFTQKSGKVCIFQAHKWALKHATIKHKNVSCSLGGEFKGGHYFLEIQVILQMYTKRYFGFENCGGEGIEFNNILEKLGQQEELNVCYQNETNVASIETVYARDNVKVYIHEVLTKSDFVIIFNKKLSTQCTVYYKKEYMFKIKVEILSYSWLKLNGMAALLLRNDTNPTLLELCNCLEDEPTKIYYILLIASKLSVNVTITLNMPDRNGARKVGEAALSNLIVTCQNGTCATFFSSPLTEDQNTISKFKKTMIHISKTTSVAIEKQKNETLFEPNVYNILTKYSSRPVNKFWNYKTLYIIVISISIVVIGVLCIFIIRCFKRRLLHHKHILDKSFVWMNNDNYNLNSKRGSNKNFQQFQEIQRLISYKSENTQSLTNYNNTQLTSLCNTDISSQSPMSKYTYAFSSDDCDSDNDNRNNSVHEILECDLKIIKCIGLGAFGKVFSALYSHDNIEEEVAAKEIICISKNDIESSQETMKELLMMMKIGKHSNVVLPIGFCKRRDNTTLLLMEYCSKGSLKDYLGVIFNEKSYPLDLLNQFSKDVAMGMEYLASKNIIHRDLATRNVLLSQEFNCKISDFGLSRQLPLEESYYLHVHGAIPLKWMAPEVLLQNKYSTMADIWSYGVLLWEIYTLGEVPYKNFTMSQVKDLIKNGYRMSIPDSCPILIQNIINECWNFEAVLRPKFSDIIFKM